MKIIKIIIFLLLVLFTYSVLAAETTLKVGQSITESGHLITLFAVGTSNNIIVDVDGVKTIIAINDKKTVNGVQIEVIEATEIGADSTARLFISIIEADSSALIEKCGNDDCETGEDKSTCCKDCGCESGYSCIDEENKCVKNECTSDEQCYATPKDFCSLDKCKGTPKKCMHIPIIECVINDRCCPVNCYYPEDPDCPSTKLNPNPPKKNLTETNPAVEKMNKTQALNQTANEAYKESFLKKIINWILNIFK